MSADNELAIVLKFVDQASQGAARWHSGERQRARQTANAQIKADKDTQKARDATYKAMADAAKANARLQQQVEKEAAAARRAALKEVAAEAKAQARDVTQSARQSARERQSLEREVNATLRKLARQESRDKTQAEREKAAAAKKAIRDEIYDIKTAHQVKMQQWKWEQDASKENANTQKSAIASTVVAYGALKGVTTVVQGIQEAWQASAHSMKDSNDYIETMVAHMEEMRDRTREILAMRGEKPSGANASKLAGEAEEASVNTGNYVKFSESLQANVAGHVQPENAPEAEKKNYRLTQEQTKEVSKFAASYAASQGVDMDSAAELLSTVVTTAKTDDKGKVSTADIKTQYAKALGTLQTMRGRTAQDARQFAETAQKLAGQGGNVQDIQDLAAMFAAQAEVHPGESSVHMNALFRGLAQVRAQGRQETRTGNHG